MLRRGTARLTRIGIFPGAFDPIHEGHIAFACAAGKQLKLDKIFFIVEPRPHRKQGVRALEHRIAMVQLAIANDLHFGVIVVEESRFAIDSTWPKIRARFEAAEVYMIMGEDNLDHILHWPQLDDFVESAPQFVIGVRNEQTRHELQDTLHTMQHTKSFPFLYHFVAMPFPEVHSRSLRAHLRKGDVLSQLAPIVVGYIQANKLYSSATTAK